jgi:mannose-6-phosphate isomerase-like protein (cupin superfamily)
MKRRKFLVASVATIPAFTNVLGFNLSEGSTKNHFVVRSGSSRYGESIKFQGVHPNDVLISKKDTDSTLSIIAFTGYGQIGPPLHVHFNQDEFFYVVEGNYRFVCGNETMELSAGDIIFLPRQIPHTWKQLTEYGKLLYGVQPAGAFEEFFNELSDLKHQPTEEEFQQIHIRHDMKVLGPPL